MKKKKLIGLLKYSVIALIFFFIFEYLYVNINSINLNEIKFDFFYLFVSIIIYLIHILFNNLIWYIITKQNNCNIGFFDTIKVHIYSDFGKYIPGKVFTYGVLLFNYGQREISKKKIMICSIQELIISTLTIILISLISIFISDIEEFNEYKSIFLLLSILCLIFIHPKILQYFSNLILKILKKEPVVITFTYKKIIPVLILFFFSWFIFGWSFYFFINSFYQYPINQYFLTTGAFAIAGLGGFLAVFAPGGLGVREGILVFTLSLIFPAAIAAIISLGSRIWMTFCELLLLLIIQLISYFIKHTSNNLEVKQNKNPHTNTQGPFYF